MPRKRTTITAADEPLARLPLTAPTAPPAVPPSALAERREQDLEDLLSELGTDGRIKIWHVIDGKSSYAGEMSLDGFTLDALTDAFGGGDKTLVFYQGREKKETLRVSLDPSIPPRNPKAPRPNVAQTPNAGVGLGDMTALIAAMAQSSMSSMQMMQTMMAQSQQMTTTMLNAVATVLASRKDERDPMDVAVRMAELIKGNGGNTPASELFTIFEKGMNVAKNLGGSDEDGTLSLAKEGLSLVGKIVEKQTAQTAAPVARRLPPNVPPGSRPMPNGRPVGEGDAVSAAPSASAPPSANATSGAGIVDVADGPERPWVAAARPAAALLLLAIGNVQPDTAANMIADRLTEEQFGDLLDDIEAGTPGEFVSRFARYFAIEDMDDNTTRWMLDCVASIRALVEPETDLPTDTESATS